MQGVPSDGPIVVQEFTQSHDFSVDDSDNVNYQQWHCDQQYDYDRYVLNISANVGYFKSNLPTSADFTFKTGSCSFRIGAEYVGSNNDITDQYILVTMRLTGAEKGTDLFDKGKYYYNYEITIDGSHTAYNFDTITYNWRKGPYVTGTNTSGNVPCSISIIYSKTEQFLQVKTSETATTNIAESSYGTAKNGLYESFKFYADEAHIFGITVNECDNGNGTRKMTVDEKLTYYANETYTLPDDPVKEGYDFVGWYLDEELTQPYNGEPITADTQLYAKFEIKKVTVTFDTDGGSEIEPITVELNGSIEPNSYVPSKEGHTFTGWYLPDGTQYTNQAITEDITLTAHWELKSYTINFDTNGGSVMEQATVTHGTTYAPGIPVKEGYNFAGWYEDEELTAAYDSTAGITSDKTLYAKWEIKTYTVSFDTAGGNEISDITVNHGAAAELPETPTRTGYNFLGWFLGDNTEYTNQPITANTIIFAHWAIKMFTVTFYVDGEVYTTAEVAYGTKLVSVMTETANLMNLQVTSLSAPAEGNFSEVTVTEDLDVTVEEMTGADKVLNVMKNNVWWIVGGAAGVVVLIGAIVAAVCIRRSNKTVKRGRR